MNLDRRQQIVMSYGILALLLIVALLMVLLPPITGRLQLLSSMETSAEIYSRSIEAIQRMDEAAAAGSTAIDESLLLHADTDALAAAELQQTIANLVGGEGGSLVSTAHRRGGTDAPLTIVPVAVRLRSSVTSLVSLLQALDDHEPRLFVSDLLIQSRHRQGRPLQNLQDELDVQFDIAGFLAPTAEEP